MFEVGDRVRVNADVLVGKRAGIPPEARGRNLNGEEGTITNVQELNFLELLMSGGKDGDVGLFVRFDNVVGLSRPDDPDWASGTISMASSYVDKIEATQAAAA